MASTRMDVNAFIFELVFPATTPPLEKLTVWKILKQIKKREKAYQDTNFRLQHLTLSVARKEVKDDFFIRRHLVIRTQGKLLCHAASGKHVIKI